MARRFIDISAPAVVSAIDRQIAFHAGGLLPFMKVGHVHQLVRRFCPMKDLYLLIFIAVIERVHDAGAQRNETDSAGNKDEILSVILLHGKSIAVRTTNRKMISGPQPMQG